MEEKIKKLEELYGDLSNLTPEKMETLVAESIHTFEQILEKLNQGSEEEQAQARQYAQRLKVHLEKQAEKALGSLKVSYEDLEEFTSDPKNFSEEEWKALSEAKRELESYRNHIKNTKTAEELRKEAEEEKTKRTSVRKKRAKNTQWIAG